MGLYVRQRETVSVENIFQWLPRAQPIASAWFVNRGNIRTLLILLNVKRVPLERSLLLEHPSALMTRAPASLDSTRAIIRVPIAQTVIRFACPLTPTDRFVKVNSQT